MTDPEFQQSRLKSPTGADLALYTYEAETTPRGIVQINHGLAEYAGRYAPFAAYLASRGYHTIGHDHRGHGRTEAEDGAPRRFADKDGWIKVMDDVAAVQVEARKRWPDRLHGPGLVNLDHIGRDGRLQAAPDKGCGFGAMTRRLAASRSSCFRNARRL